LDKFRAGIEAVESKNSLNQAKSCGRF